MSSTARRWPTCAAPIASGVFVDGVLSSGWASRLVKNNEQLGAGPALEAAQQKVIAALTSNPVFSRRRAAAPFRAAALCPLRARHGSSARTWTIR